MGINGLIPFLEKTSRAVNVKEYAGSAVAIDAYCWLHKGAFSCADKLAMNEPTLLYVNYCMKFVNMLISHNIKPILVFDGQNLPAKLQTEIKRRENRDINRRKGQELLRAGRVAEGRNYLRRSLDVSHEMALEVIKECRRRNVDCIVAPYEADAQLAYLNLKNIVQVVITEDSDLLLFGCKAVLFKMDHNGNGLLIEKDKIHLSMGIRSDAFTLEKFRLMCILSGCDYIDSLPGIGLVKACKFVKRMCHSEFSADLKKIASILNMRTLEVSEEYIKGVLSADHTFRCQIVFDPLTRKQVPLTEPLPGEGVVGDIRDPETAFQLALGNLHPKDLRKMDSYDPDVALLATSTLRGKDVMRSTYKSIWSKGFSLDAVSKPKSAPTIFRSSVLGKSETINWSPSALKRNSFDENGSSDDDLLKLYSLKKQCPSSPIKTEERNTLTSRYFKNEVEDDDSDDTLVNDILNNLDVTEKKEACESRCEKETENSSEDGIFTGISISPVHSVKSLDQDSAICSDFSSETIANCKIENYTSQKLETSSPSISKETGNENKSPVFKLKTPQRSLNFFKSSSSNSLPSKLFTGENSIGLLKLEIDTVGTKESIFFSPVCEKTHLKETKASPKTNSVKKTPGRARVGLSRPKSSSQSLLTNFGFQPRAKLANGSSSSS